MAGDDDSRAAMPLAPVIEGELDFRADPERPLGQEADSLGRPVDLVLDEVDGVRETNRYARTLASQSSQVKDSLRTESSTVQILAHADFR